MRMVLALSCTKMSPVQLTVMGKVARQPAQSPDGCVWRLFGRSRSNLSLKGGGGSGRALIRSESERFFASGSVRWAQGQLTGEIMTRFHHIFTPDRHSEPDNSSILNQIFETKEIKSPVSDCSATYDFLTVVAGPQARCHCRIPKCQCQLNRLRALIHLGCKCPQVPSTPHSTTSFTEPCERLRLRHWNLLPIPEDLVRRICLLA